MKKILTGILASTMVLSSISMSFAQETSKTTDFSGETAVYTQTLSTAPESHFTFVDGVITKYVGTGGDVVIPSTINGQEVIRIGEKAFMFNSEVTSVVVPDTVLVIDLSAFDACNNMVSITLPVTLQSLGTTALRCSKLSVVNYGGSDISWKAISQNCGLSASATIRYALTTDVVVDTTSPTGTGTALDTSTLPVAPESHFTFVDGVITDYLGSAEVLVIPSTINGQEVIRIGQEAFKFNDNITTVVIPDTVLVIDQSAFDACGNLVSITMPTSVTTLGVSCFRGSSFAVFNYGGSDISFKAISGYISVASDVIIRYGNDPVPTTTASDTKMSWEGEVAPATHFEFKDGVITKYLGFGGNVIIPSTIDGQKVERIGEAAFKFNSDLITVTIPNTVTVIDQSAFDACGNLVSVTLPLSIQSLGTSSFRAGSLAVANYEGTKEDWNAISNSGAIGSTVLFRYGYGSNNSSSTPTTPETTTPDVVGVPDWAQTYVKYAISSGILPNISASNMDSASSRGLIAQALYNYAGNGANVNPSHSFTDTGDYSKAIAWCYANGLMSGTGTTTFGTYGNVTREQFALILRALASYEGRDVSGDTSVLSQFSDQNLMNDWAKEGIAWAVNAGLMEGNNGKLDPQGAVTQVQVAIMMQNM